MLSGEATFTYFIVWFDPTGLLNWKKGWYVPFRFMTNGYFSEESNSKMGTMFNYCLWLDVIVRIVDFNIKSFVMTHY